MSVHPKHWWRTVNPLFAGDACRDPSPFAVTPRSNPGTSLRPAFDTASGFHGTPILERLLWVLKKYSFLDTSEFTSPGYFSQQKKPLRDMYFVSQRWLSLHTHFFFLQMNTLSMESQQDITIILLVITQLPICDLVSLLQLALCSDFDQMLY